MKLPSAKLDRDPSTSRIKSPKRIDKQCKATGSTKSLNGSYRIENMNIETDNVFAIVNLDDKKYEWNWHRNIKIYNWFFKRNTIKE